MHAVAAAGFVAAGIGFAFSSDLSPQVIRDSAQHFGPLQPNGGQIGRLGAIAISRLYLQPINFLMWSLLAAVWITVALDVVGQWIDPTEQRRSAGPRVRKLVLVALVAAAAAPWLFPRAPLGLAAMMALASGSAVIAAHRAAGRQRPAIGFLAGWLTAVTSAAMAALVGTQFEMPMEWVAALAILPATAFGMAAQMWIGQSIGYSAALIWAFCALAITTMSSDPTIALAAILGIAGMASVLVRAAS